MVVGATAGTAAMNERDPAVWPDTLRVLASAAIPRCPSFDEFRAAATGRAEHDLAFQHSSDLMLDMLPQGLERGRNWFGPGDCPLMTASTVHPMRGVCSYAISDAVLSPKSMAVVKWGGDLLDASVNNLSFWAGEISAIDPNFVDTPEGRVFLCHPDDIPLVDCIAVPVCGVGFASYGHFLFDGLGVAWLLKQAIDDPRVRLVGPPLLAWQAELLDLLGCRERYMAITAPTRFGKLLFSDSLSFQTAYPARFVRPLFDAVRFRCGDPEYSGRRVLLSRSGDLRRRRLRNRIEMESLFASHGFEILRPERMSIADQVLLLAGSRFVAGETGSALANIGFCDPGATVLEIIPDSYPDNWIRSAARIFGHDWHGYFAKVDRAGAASYHQFAFEIDLAQLDGALERIGRRMVPRR